MGKRIRKKWDLPSEQGVSLLALGSSFLLGGCVGCLTAALSSGEGAGILCEYLSDYLILAGQGGLPSELWPALWGQLKYLLAVMVLGFTVIGVLGIPLLMGIRGFFLAFSAACFVRVFGSAGAFPAFILFGLPALLWAPALFLAGVQSWSGALALLHRMIGDGGRRGFYLGTLDWGRAGLCVGLTLGCGLLEYWVVPVLLRAAARVVL